MSKIHDFLQTLKDRLDLSEVVTRHVALKKAGGRSFKGLCPFHNEKGPSFYVHNDKGFFHCFGCGERGDHVDFIMKKLNMSFIEGVQHLADQVGMEVPSLDKNTDTQGHVVSSESTILYEIHELATQWYHQQLLSPQGDEARQYLHQRGLSPETVQKFRLGYAPDNGLKCFLTSKGFSEDILVKGGLIIQPENGRSAYDRFRDRVMFPIQDRRDRVIAFGGRIMGKGDAKYLNSPETLIFYKGRQLYGLNHSLPSVRSGSAYILVEGYMDVIALHQAGITSAVAPLGTALTPEQLTLMWKTCPKPVLCFDGDTAGRRAAYRSLDRVLEIITPEHTVAFCFLPEGEDPDSLVKKYSVTAFREILTQSVSLIDMIWQVFMEQRSLKSPEDKAKARKELGSVTQPIQDPIIRKEFQDELWQRLNDRIRAMFQRSDNRSAVGGPLGSQNNLIQRQKKDLHQNKIAFGEKILLASLINHPILIVEVAEQLMMLMLEDPELEGLQHFLVAYGAQTPNVDRQTLIESLYQNGFEPLVKYLLNRTLYEKARFAHPSIDPEEVLKGWQEIWESLQVHRHLQEDRLLASTELKSTLTQQAWEKLKALTTSLTYTGN